jgi:hypothetical protein
MTICSGVDFQETQFVAGWIFKSLEAQFVMEWIFKDLAANLRYRSGMLWERRLELIWERRTAALR